MNQIAGNRPEIIRDCEALGTGFTGKTGETASYRSNSWPDERISYFLKRCGRIIVVVAH